MWPTHDNFNYGLETSIIYPENIKRDDFHISERLLSDPDSWDCNWLYTYIVLDE